MHTHNPILIQLWYHLVLNSKSDLVWKNVQVGMINFKTVLKFNTIKLKQALNGIKEVAITGNVDDREVKKTMTTTNW